MSEIRRSAGEGAVVNGMVTGFIVGGGYQGITKELDDMVAEAAERLSEMFGIPVVIRFNSGRRRGGAWIDEGGNHHDASLGVSAGLKPIIPEGKSRRDFSSQEFDRLPQIHLCGCDN